MSNNHSKIPSVRDATERRRFIIPNTRHTLKPESSTDIKKRPDMISLSHRALAGGNTSFDDGPKQHFTTVKRILLSDGTASSFHSIKTIKGK